MLLSLDEKLKLMNLLNWDYNVSPVDMLDVIEGRKEVAGPFDRKKLFIRSLDRISWNLLISLWGIDTAKLLYTPEISQQLRFKDLRRRYDFAFSVLRGEAVSVPKWGDESYKRLQNTVFSNRWYRTKWKD